MAKIGRPTKYRPEMCETVIKLMSQGASHIEVMAELGIWEDTFYRWKKNNEPFSEAVKKGEQLSAAWWEREGRTSLRDRDFSYTGWYMNMKNRFGWKDKVEASQEKDKEGKPIKWEFEIIENKSPKKD